MRTELSTTSTAFGSYQRTSSTSNRQSLCFKVTPFALLRVHLFVDIPNLAVAVGSKRATAHEIIHEKLKQRWHAPEQIYLPYGLSEVPQVQFFLSKVTSLQFTFMVQLLVYVTFLVLLMYVSPIKSRMTYLVRLPFLSFQEDGNLFFGQYIENQILQGNGGRAGDGSDFRVFPILKNFTYLFRRNS